MNPPIDPRPTDRRTTRSRGRLVRRAAAAGALSVALLAATATAASAQDASVLPPLDPGVQAILAKDSVDATAGITNVRLLAVLAVARAQIGKPYQFAARGPAAFDCSGFVQYVYRAAGYRIGGWTGAQLTDGKPVPDIAHLQPGDLIFIPGVDGTMTDPQHVGLYLGAGLVIQATHTGDFVRITPLASWYGQIVTIRRIIPTTTATTTTTTPAAVDVAPATTTAAQ
jgi:cell wall-associated NlpC family hydrolase